MPAATGAVELAMDLPTRVDIVREYIQIRLTRLRGITLEIRISATTSNSLASRIANTIVISIAPGLVPWLAGSVGCPASSIAPATIIIVPVG